MLCFTKEEAEVRKQALPIVPARYMRTSDVISEVDCVLLQRKRGFEKQCGISEFTESKLLLSKRR